MLLLFGPLVINRPVAAASRDPFIEEIMAGVNGDSRAQFIVINQSAVGQNLWGPNGAAQARGMLVFYDAGGRETGIFKFPANPPTGGTLRTLLATADFAALPGAPVPDVVIPPLLNAISGKVCFRSNPANVVFQRNECVSYGAFTGATETNSGDLDGAVAAGVPAAPQGLPIVDVVSLRRSSDTGRNADFVLATTPTPQNIVGDTVTLLAAAAVTQGSVLFNAEGFQGNGRTCASCHAPSQSFRLPPSDVQTRFAALATTFDPLFVGEAAPSSFDAGFDANLNTLTLTAAPSDAAPCIGQLGGVITATTGRATILARVSPTSYLLYGGANPTLTGTVADNRGCSAAVVSVTQGSLAVAAGSAVAGLENPLRMRRSNDAAFPQGRALILENIDGFPPAVPVFRKSPHIVNASRTAPFGFSGDIPDLRTFSTGAVTQHFTRTLARSSAGAAPDFRSPTTGELAYLEAFMLAQEFPAGSDPNKFDLDRFSTTAQQRRGRTAFFGAAKCSRCHGGPVLAATTVSILGKSVGVNASFNTGVVNQAINGAGPGRDNLRPTELNGAREFSVPQLLNVPNLAPFFHDASASTLNDAVNFYDTPAFNGSPAGIAIGGINLSGQTQNDLVAFLNGLTTRPYSVTRGPIRFGAQSANAGATAAQSIVVTNTGSSALSFGATPCAVTSTTNNAGDFNVTACPLTTPLAAGESRTVQVTFDPNTNGLKTATLELGAALPSGVDLFGVGGTLGPAPALTAISPTFGSGSGGTAVTLQGTGFVAGATVSIGGVSAGTVVVVSAGIITAVTPAMTAGFADVVVTNPDAQSATLSNGFNCLGVSAIFSDDPLVSGTTGVRAIHLSELRQYIDALRARYGLASFVWTDQPIVPGVTNVKGQHVIELQTALLGVYAAAGRTAPSFSAPASAGTTPITALQLSQIRSAIRAIW